MKNILITAGLTVIITLGFTSCGKKAEDHKSNGPESLIDESITNLQEETHKELQAAILAGDVAKIKKILETQKQVDLDKVLEDGQTLMTMAIAENQIQIVELLLEAKASLFRSNSKHETVVMVAARLGHETIVKLLISLGAKTDNKDDQGNTALHLAILNGHEEIALYLINNKTNYDITNNDNQTPLKLAEILQMKEVVKLLKSMYQTSVSLPDKPSVTNLVTLGNQDNLAQLINKYPTILTDYADLNFYVLVINAHPHDAALSMTNLLMSKGANLGGPTNATTTPLIEAVKKEYEDFVKLILNENVNPNVFDTAGVSPLMWAIRKNNQPIVKLLLEKSAQEKYVFYENGKKKTIKACDEARDVRSTLKTDAAKKSNEDIMDLLGCGLRWLF